MVYESDFYTTRRYRTSPSLSTYTVSSVPSRQVRVLPGLGKVHIVHTYDRIVPYVGHKRLTVVTMPPKVYSTRPSILHKEYDRIENKLRPWYAYSATNRYLNSDSAVIFDDETRLIRAQTASLLKRIHSPVPRLQRTWPLINNYVSYDEGIPVRFTNDHYIHRMITTSSTNPRTEYTTYYSAPVRKYIGTGRLASMSYAGDMAYPRRNHIWLYEDPLKSDIQLLSFYINKFRQEKAQQSSENKAERAERADNRSERSSDRAESENVEDRQQQPVITEVSDTE